MIENKLFPKFKKVYEFAAESAERLASPQLRNMFTSCYLNTLETTVRFTEDGGVFVITGDIEAMWLRDSSAQVSHYVRLAALDSDVDELCTRLLNRQFSYILADPYANAFNESPNGRGHDDDTKRNPLVWERKFEIDSLIYPLWLLNLYYETTGNTGVFSPLFYETYQVILGTLVKEQNPRESDYYFRRSWDNGIDTLDNGGYGPDCAYTGMVRSAFRPSDDKCLYPFLVPSNMFAVTVLRRLNENLARAGLNNPFKEGSERLCSQIFEGINRYAMVDTVEFGRVFAYEVDGLGNKLLMDDANVPSLLAMPYMGCCKKTNKEYLNTRRMILSDSNPYYFRGYASRGVGSPHTPYGHVWHIGLIIEALTTDDKGEILRILENLMKTDARTGYMHESFDCNDPFVFTRSWFAWANTMFAILVMDKLL